MASLKITRTPLPGVLIIEPERHGDSRGYFCETFRADLFAGVVPGVVFVQDNESLSCRGVVRGLHYQAGAFAQAKLVRVTRGAIIDVVVDLRRSSPTFGRYFSAELSADNGLQLFVPRGFAHGFAVVSDEAQFQYKVDNSYAPHAERTIAFDDPDLAIVWPFGAGEMILSDKDRRGIPFRLAETFA